MGTTTGSTEMTSGLREVPWKKYCILPLQCEIQTIREKPFFHGNVNEADTYCLLTCYFENLPHMRNVGFIAL